MFKYLRRIAVFVLTFFVAVAALLAVFQNKIIYHPQGYRPEELKSPPARPLRYQTGAGIQVAWLYPRQQTDPEHIFLVFPGNATRALDMSGYFQGAVGDEKNLIVILDYPGFGLSEGSPTPQHFRDSIKSLLPALAKELRTNEEALRRKTSVFGQSLGCAAALMAMNELHLKKGTLVSPFTSMLSMSQRTVGWPLCLVLHHRFDNVAELQAIEKAGGKVQIFHGNRDVVIPDEEGKSLADCCPQAAQFFPADGAGHNHILEAQYLAIMTSLKWGCE